MRVVVVGKCHSRGIASSWQALRPADEVSTITWVQLRKGYTIDRLISEVQAADLVFLEANAAGKRDLSARELGVSVNDESVPQLVDALAPATLYPVTHFSGFHPDLVRIDKIGCSQIVVAAHALGMSQPQAAELFNGYVYGLLGYFDEYSKAQRFMLQVGQASGMDLSEVLQPVEGVSFMHTPNQPTIDYWMRFSAMLCKTAGLEYDSHAQAPFDEPAQELVWPVYPEIADRIGVKGCLEFKVSKKQGPVSFEEMISSCYRVFEGADLDEVHERTHTRAVIAKLRAELG